jgi:hypothetical protein
MVVRDAPPPTPGQPRLPDRVRAAIHAPHYSRRTEKAYTAWARRFILFHGERHPMEMGATKVTQFPSALVVAIADRRVSRTRRIGCQASDGPQSDMRTVPGYPDLAISFVRDRAYPVSAVRVFPLALPGVDPNILFLRPHAGI